MSIKSRVHRQHARRSARNVKRLLNNPGKYPTCKNCFLVAFREVVQAAVGKTYNPNKRCKAHKQGKCKHK